MKTEGVIATAGLVMARLVELYGIDSQAFMTQAGVNPQWLRDTNARIPGRLVEVMFQRAAALIPDPAFALKAARCWHPSNLGTLGYAWLSSGTLRTALKRMERFSRILDSRHTYRCVDRAQGLAFVYDHGRGAVPTAAAHADFTLSILVAMCRMNFGDALNPLEINLRRFEPADPSPYQDFYRCDIRYGADEDSLLLARRVADTPLASANRELAATFDHILSKQLALLSETDLATRCKSLLLQQLTSGEPSEEDLAASLLMSRRTLQRKLDDLGVTYKQLLGQARYDLALRYLDEPQRSVTEITFLLGFSEQSAFTRAFKRWSGTAPTTHRAREASAAA